MTSQKRSLKLITAPAVGHAIQAPPVLMASDNSVQELGLRAGEARRGREHGSGSRQLQKSTA